MSILALAFVPIRPTDARPRGSVALLCLGIGGLIPPTLTGHSATGNSHHSAVTSLLVHVVAMTLWVGGLVACHVVCLPTWGVPPPVYPVVFDACVALLCHRRRRRSSERFGFDSARSLIW